MRHCYGPSHTQLKERFALNVAAPPQPAPDAVRIKRLEQTIRDSIEALERNSTSAPVVECLKAALSPCLRYVNDDAELVCKCVNGKYPEVVDVERRPPTCKAVASHDGERP